MKKALWSMGLLLLWQTLAQAQPQGLSHPGRHATTPYFTTDHRGRAVLAWSEQDQAAKTEHFYFATSPDGGKTWGAPVAVPVNEGPLSTHNEGMPKVAFRADGSVVAVYGIKRPTPENPRISVIYFVQSADGGRTWSAPAYLHGSAEPGTGYSFFDVAALPDGEVGAVWLDGKAPGQAKGRMVKFAKTAKGAGFQAPVVIEPVACECCRTDLVADGQRLHVAYRALLPDGSRDMAHATSVDGGATWSQPRRISADQWQVSGCPHTGPSIAVGAKGLTFSWFTGKEGQAGVYTCTLARGPLAEYGPRQLAAKPPARYPQLATWGAQTVLVWQEAVPDALGQPINRIGLQGPGGAAPRYLSPAGRDAFHPAVLALPGQPLLLAYELAQGELRQVVVERVGQNGESEGGR